MEFNYYLFNLIMQWNMLNIVDLLYCPRLACGQLLKEQISIYRIYRRVTDISNGYLLIKFSWGQANMNGAHKRWQLLYQLQPSFCGRK